MRTEKATKFISYSITVVLILCFVFAVGCTGTSAEIRDDILEEYNLEVKVKRTSLNGTVAYKWISGEFNAVQKRDIHKRVSQYYPTSRVREASVKYNCHSYAWYSTSASNIYWIDNPSKFMDGATFKCIQTSSFNEFPSSVRANYRAVYYTNSRLVHSAIVYNVSSDLFISKWGPAGLYTHKIKKCPYYMPNSTYIKYYQP